MIQQNMLMFSIQSSHFCTGESGKKLIMYKICISFKNNLNIDCIAFAKSLMELGKMAVLYADRLIALQLENEAHNPND